MGLRWSDGETVFETDLGGVIRGLGHADGVLYVGTLSGEILALPLQVDG